MAISNQAKTCPPAIRTALTEKQCQPETVLEHIDEGDDLVVGMFNSEPLTVLDAIEANAERLSGIRIHQMLPHRERRYMHGDFPGLHHVSWFLSPANREAFHKDTCELVPNNFSEVPALMQHPHGMLAGADDRLASGSTRLLLAWHPCGLRRSPHRGGPLLCGGEPPDASHLWGEPGAYKPSSRMVRGRLLA